MPHTYGDRYHCMSKVAEQTRTGYEVDGEDGTYGQVSFPLGSVRVERRC